MPALFLVLGLAVVVFIAAAGHHKHPVRGGAQVSPGPVVELDRGMPPSVVAQVLAALGEETDAARLDALATAVAGFYPLAAGELRARAASFRAAAPESGSPSTPTVTDADGSIRVAPAANHPAAEESPAKEESPPPTERTPAPQFDAAEVLQAAMRALVEETDPVVLEGFAASIRTRYPEAAEILSARARVLRTASAGGSDGPPSLTTRDTNAATPALAPEARS